MLFRCALPAVFLLAACAPPQSPNQGSAPVTGPAHALVMKATSCWTGGLWADALGETGDQRTMGIQQRCESLLRDIDVTPEEGYYPLRAMDSKQVDAITAKVNELAAADEKDRPHAKDLVNLLHAIAGATHETQVARRAADVVKEDAAQHPAPESYAEDKRAAAAPLLETRALHALLVLDGPYASEARAIGLMEVVDRMEIARGLTKRLKFDVVSGPFVDVFGVPSPEQFGDPAGKATSGTWLAYLSTVASTGGHAPPANISDLTDKETLAWTGVLAGLGDKLRQIEIHDAGSDLERVARAISTRADEQLKNEMGLATARAHQ